MTQTRCHCCAAPKNQFCCDTNTCHLFLLCLCHKPIAVAFTSVCTHCCVCVEIRFFCVTKIVLFFSVLNRLPLLLICSHASTNHLVHVSSGANKLSHWLILHPGRVWGSRCKSVSWTPIEIYKAASRSRDQTRHSSTKKIHKTPHLPHPRITPSHRHPSDGPIELNLKSQKPIKNPT